MATRNFIPDTGAGPDRQATNGHMLVGRYYPGPDDTGTYIHATPQKVTFSNPLPAIPLEVGQVYTFTPVQPAGERIYAYIPAGAGDFTYADLVPVDPDSLLPSADPGPAWFVALQDVQDGFAGKQDVATLDADTAGLIDTPGSAIETVVSAKIGQAVDTSSRYAVIESRTKLTTESLTFFPNTWASLDRKYLRGTANPAPAAWPVDHGRQKVTSVGGGQVEYQTAPVNYGYTRYRTMCDGASFQISLVPAANGGLTIWIDGYKMADTHRYTASGLSYARIVFNGGAKPRLIEWEMSATLYAVETAKPYKCWKPAPVDTTLMYVIGDSFVKPNVYMDNGLDTYFEPAYFGIYQSIGPYIGVDEVITDGVDGTGYISADPDFLTRWNTLGEPNFTPDVVLIHGGGANDMYFGESVAAIQDAVVATFTQLRADLPNAKLVFVEGVVTPVAFNTYGPNYMAIRADAQTRLADVGVYYIDTVTSGAWITGLGNAGAPNADNENANIYSAPDGIHLTKKGNAYWQRRTAAALQRILRDDGSLLNQLIR